MKEKWEQWIDKNPIRLALTKEGMTQTEMASRVGVTINTIHKWLSGISQPKEENMRAIEKVLNTDINDQMDQWVKNKPS